MKEKILDGPVAYAVTQFSEYNTTDQASKLEHLHRLGQEYIEKGHSPFYDTSFLEAHINRLKAEKRGERFSFTWLPENPHGQFLNQNTQRESFVMPQLASVDSVEELLRREPDIQNIVFAVYSNGYSIFREIAKHIRKEHPHIKVIAGAVGTEVRETASLADFMIR